MSSTQPTRAALYQLRGDADCHRGLLSSQDGKLYELDILRISPETLQVELKAPRGRQAPVRPERHWCLSFSRSTSAIQVAVTQVIPRGDSLIFVLAETCSRVARRKHMRLPLNSRNPANLMFRIEQTYFKATLADVSLEGMGILLPWTSLLQEGKLVRDGRFHVRGQALGFVAARIVHREQLPSDQMRLGLSFHELSTDQKEAIQATIQRWSQSSEVSSPIPVDG